MTGPRHEVSVYQDPADWPPDVHALFESAERQNVQFGEVWYRNLIDTVFVDRGANRFHVLRSDGRAVAGLALRLSQSTGARTITSLTNFYTCLYAPALVPGTGPEALAPLIASVVKTHAPLASIRLGSMDPASEGYRCLLGAFRLVGLAPFSYFCYGNWFLRIDTGWAAYLKSRDGMLRSTLKRMGKRFAADAGTLELITGAERLAAGLAAYETVYAASWKNAEPFPAFMPGLIRRCAEKGWLRLGVAWLGDRAIAAQVWIVADGRAEIYKLAYDEAFKAYSPGTLLTARLMQHVIDEDRVREVDYLIGDDPYKQAWMTERRERWGIIAYNPATLAGRFGAWRERIGRLAKPLVTRWRARSGDAAAA